MQACSEIEKIALTHRGFVREVNEDRHYVECIGEQALLMAVVDGMGGGPAGSAAAEIMREALTEYPADAPNPEKALSNLVVTASEAILEFARNDPALEGMGTTVTATYLSNGTACWAHVGDTRFYVFRQDRLIQVTTDQTMAQFLVEEDRITPDEARTDPYGHLLDQCVGCPDCNPVISSCTPRTACTMPCPRTRLQQFWGPPRHLSNLSRSRLYRPHLIPEGKTT